MVAVAVAAVLFLSAAESPGTIAQGTTVGGIDIGGLSAAAATEKVAAASAAALRRPVTVRAGESVSMLSPEAAGFTVDAERSVAAALAPSAPEPSAVRAAWDRIVGRGRARDLPLYVEADDVRLASAMDEVALSAERLVKDARLILERGRPKAVAAEPGLILDRAALRAALVRAIAEGESEVDAPIREIVPAVTTEDAQSALAVARAALADPLTLGYQGAQFEIAPEELSAMAAPDPSGIGAGKPITFDTDAARELLGERLRPLEDPPVDAQVVPSDDGRGFTVRPSSDGTLVEWPALLASMTRVALERGRRYVPVPTTTVRPRLTTLDAQELRERREIASFTTYFSPASLARVKNIQQVAQLLNGYVIRPGETFSFNKVAGPRTRAAGFDEAPVIRDGVLTPGVGGGICQVSTTLFNAVFFAGLPVVERQPHSFYIDHYPVGRDATVSYGSVDFRFRNDSEYRAAALGLDHVGVGDGVSCRPGVGSVGVLRDVLLPRPGGASEHSRESTETPRPYAAPRFDVRHGAGCERSLGGGEARGQRLRRGPVRGRLRQCVRAEGLRGACEEAEPPSEIRVSPVRSWR